MAIHFGGSVLDITIDGGELASGGPLEVKQFETDVLHQLRDVLDVYGQGKYKTGRWVMEELTKKLFIAPSLMQKSDVNGNGVIDPQGHPVYITGLNSVAAWMDWNQAVSGSAPLVRASGTAGARIPGPGSDVVIRYSPTIWWYVDGRRVGMDARKHTYVPVGPDERYYLGSDKLASQPDDVLLHELFHAYREMNGLLDTLSPFDDDYPTKEEFFAVLITNIYVSERNTTYQPRLLRGKYTVNTDGKDSMFHDLENDPKFQDSKTHHFSTTKFYDRYEDAIGEVISDMSIRFRDRLASVPAEFNPIALWVQRHPNG